jgi:hypothetical protein
MMRKVMMTVAAFVAVVTVSLLAADGSYAQDAPVTDADARAELLAACPICDVDLTGYTGPLTQAEVESLLLALNDEYHAYAVYASVIDQFGAVRPVTNIQRAETNHANAVVRLMERYAVPVPENAWLGTDFPFATVSEACAAGVEAELLNRDLYDILFASTDRADLTRVFASLQRASEENHLPAFERCTGW